MAKFHGMIGFIQHEVTAPGVSEGIIVERPYFGDVLRSSRRWQDGQTLNDNLTMDVRISIVADDFAVNNTNAMRYVEYSGSLWKITSVEIQRPRLILSIGEVYNG